ncbi:hypothetical protein XocBAI15_14775 [Xanthomonas oryzae pv. oryzicola]|nr:hypothetical protein XocBAI15_14775 [Xanthomonas oryzae pv. oryzicola]OWB32668.1 hypothetical protein XocBAI20_02610 [Xanthomonas oryzae pv. oryzicola]
MASARRIEPRQRRLAPFAQMLGHRRATRPTPNHTRGEQVRTEHATVTSLDRINRPQPMLTLDRTLAQSSVDRAMTIIDGNVDAMDHCGVIIASGAPARFGRLHARAPSVRAHARQQPAADPAGPGPVFSAVQRSGVVAPDRAHHHAHRQGACAARRCILLRQLSPAAAGRRPASGLAS